MPYKSDPFEVSKVKVPKLNTGLSGAQKAGRKVKNASKHAYQNATSKPTHRQPYTGAKFGSRDDGATRGEYPKKASFRLGLAGGALGGTLASTVVHSPEINRNNRKAEALNKARSSLITDLGTAAGKTRKYPSFRAGRFAAGTAVGAGASYGLGSAELEASRSGLRRAKTNKKRRDTIAAKKNGSTTVAKQKQASGGRYAAGWAAPGLHGAVAGKKGSKLKAAGTEIGHTAVGGVGGALVGAAVSRGKLASLGGSVGSGAGALHGVSTAQSKGRYKVQKNNTTSAFGVDHGY